MNIGCTARHDCQTILVGSKVDPKRLLKSESQPQTSDCASRVLQSRVRCSSWRDSAMKAKERLGSPGEAVAGDHKLGRRRWAADIDFSIEVETNVADGGGASHEFSFASGTAGCEPSTAPSSPMPSFVAPASSPSESCPSTASIPSSSPTSSSSASEAVHHDDSLQLQTARKTLFASGVRASGGAAANASGTPRRMAGLGTRSTPDLHSAATSISPTTSSGKHHSMTKAVQSFEWQRGPKLLCNGEHAAKNAQPLGGRLTEEDRVAVDEQTEVSADEVTAPAAAVAAVAQPSRERNIQRQARLQRLRELRDELASESSMDSWRQQQSSDGYPQDGADALLTDSAVQAPTASAMAGPSAVHARGESWLEQKRRREDQLRTEARKSEADQCTFWPTFTAQSTSVQAASRATSAPSVRATSASSVRAPVTPERARQLFERHVSWKQRLDDECERKRKERREAEEREVCEQRQRAASPRRQRSASPRPRSGHPGQRSRTGDEAFEQFLARNQLWKRARDQRVEQLSMDDRARQIGSDSSSRQRSTSRQRSNSQQRQSQQSPRCDGIHRSSQEIPVSQQDAPGINGAVHEQHSVGLQEAAASRDVSAAVVRQIIDRPALLNRPAGQPVRVPSRGSFSTAEADSEAVLSTSGAAAEVEAAGQERNEVMDHIRALRTCMLQSQRPVSVGWQRTLKIDSARKSGAGAAPWRDPESVLGSHQYSR